jgi:large exoprotein involved in heme utilization and adhesion
VQGNQSAGSLKVNASEAVEVSGFTENIPGVFSGSYLTINTLGDGNAGNLTINTGRLIVQNGAWISASTFGGRGTGGTLEINASESVALLGNTPDGLNASQIIADTGGEGAAGNVRITTGRLTIQDGGRVSALTLDRGSGGTIEINASELVEVSGQRSLGLFPSSIDTGSSGAGDAGNLSIQTPQLTVQNQGTIIVSSTGGGRAGNLTVDAPSMLLDNLASLRAQTTGGQGNILLNSRDLVLSNNSQITTNATGEATGGNININTGVLAALENSDISANAQQAQGGRVIIDASGIFGTEFRDFSTHQSDITATSELGPQFSGTVEINTELDVTSGLVETPVLPDITGLVAGGCRDYQGSSFIVTGRGGKPPSPDEPLIPESLAVVGWVELPNLDLEAERNPEVENNFDLAKLFEFETRIVEKNGYEIGQNGEVILTANQGNFSRFIPVFMPPVCPVSKGI